MLNCHRVWFGQMMWALVLAGCGSSSNSSHDSNGAVIGGSNTDLGGSPSAGGEQSMGGTSEVTDPTGGSTAVGDTVITGGSTPAGGAATTGGRSASSAPSTGGRVATGGRSSAGGRVGTGGATGATLPTGGATGATPATGGAKTTGGASATGGGAKTTGGASATGGALGTAGAAGVMPNGWLYTNGNKIYLADGKGAGSVWMGRGVNIDDLFLCGYNSTLGASGETSLLAIVQNMMAQWKPTFVRVSLSMNSYTVVSWLQTGTYKTGMNNVINAIGGHAGTYVLVTLRSDTTMVNTDGSQCGQGDDAVCLPSTATDDVYRALVSSFANAPYVLFGIANEPGGQSSTDQDLSSRMSHAVGVVRAQEDALGVPHHLVAVQGNSWTSKIGFYNTSPLAYDNVIYEYHSYPPEATGTYGYTQSKIPVIIGEYGPSGSDQSFLTTFLQDLETKQIPNLAWDLEPYSNCAPDLVQVTRTTTLTANTWGQAVQTYLLAH
jgi:hypothetical protein